MTAVVDAENMPIEQFPQYTPPRSKAPSPSPSPSPADCPSENPDGSPADCPADCPSVTPDGSPADCPSESPEDGSSPSDTGPSDTGTTDTGTPTVAMVTIPEDLAGYTSGAVTKWLKERGLAPLLTSQYSDKPVGTVIQVMPTGEWPQGSTVAVVVSKGPDPSLPAPDSSPSDDTVME
jgi:hypothetical protein